MAIATGQAERYIRPSLVVFFACQRQSHHGQLVNDLLQGLAAQVADLHHLFLGLGNQVLHRVDVGPLQAVIRADR